MNDPNKKKIDTTAAREMFRRIKEGINKPAKPGQITGGPAKRREMPDTTQKPSPPKKKVPPMQMPKPKPGPMPEYRIPRDPNARPAMPPKQPPVDKTPAPPKYRFPEDSLKPNIPGYGKPSTPKPDSGMLERLTPPTDSPLPIKIPGRKPYKIK
jgi:hypothetical protein